MYQFDNGLTPYVSYSTAFVPVQQISNAGAPLKPITSSQYEVGVKYEPIGWDTAMTLSVYDLRKQDDTYFDATTNSYRQVGESRSKGAEAGNQQQPYAEPERDRGLHLYRRADYQGFRDVPGRRVTR